MHQVAGRQNMVEHSFWISDAEHTDGTNVYTFTYPEQWRTTYNRNLTIGIRSLNMTPAPRRLTMSGVSFSDGTTTTNVDWSVMVYADEPMSVLNERLSTVSSLSGLYNVSYDPQTGVLGVYITSTDASYHLVFDSGASGSDDLNVITHATTELYSDLTGDYDSFNTKWGAGVDGCYAYLTYNTNGIRSLEFGGVWNREKVKVNASFVDLALNQFLGYTNSVFVPPKVYPITGGDIRFTIELLSAMTNTGVRLPSDGHDTLVIEAMLMLD